MTVKIRCLCKDDLDQTKVRPLNFTMSVSFRGQWSKPNSFRTK